MASPGFRYPYGIETVFDHEGVSGMPEDVVARLMDRDRALEDYLTKAGQGTIQFTTVATDGTGQFLTIKAAIESIAASGTGFIFVKPGTYSEAGLGRITIAANAKVIVWAATSFQSPQAFHINFPLPTSVTWNTDGFNATSTSVEMRIVAITVNCTGNATWISGTGSAGGTINLQFVQCAGIGSATSWQGTTAGNVVGYSLSFVDSSVGTTIFAQSLTSINTPGISAYRSGINLGPGSTTITWTPSGGAIEGIQIVDCRVSQASSAAVVLNNAGGASGRIQMRGCLCSTAAGASLALNSMRDVWVADNTGDFVLTVTNNTTDTAARITITDTNWATSTLTVNGTNADSHPIISGVYQKLVLGSHFASVDAHLDVAGTAGTALTVTANSCIINVSGRQTAAAQAYNVSGNTNFINFANQLGFTNASANTGAGNVINVS